MILVNLTCGRNPWKKASTEDSTFRAFLKDPKFLSTILPISFELNLILRRIFERDPEKRITIQELRKAILACPRLTTISYNDHLPPTPPLPPQHYADSTNCAGMVLPSTYPQDSPSPLSFQSSPPDWSFHSPASKQVSSCSSLSVDSGYESEAPYVDPSYTDSGPCVQPLNFYGNVLPLHDHEKPYYSLPGYIPAVTAF